MLGLFLLLFGEWREGDFRFGLAVGDVGIAERIGGLPVQRRAGRCAAPSGLYSDIDSLSGAAVVGGLV